MNSERIATIVKWFTPQQICDVQFFLGFGNFYCWFIKSFSVLATGLTNLLRKGVHFEWNEAAETSFKALKAAFVSASVLHQFDPALPIFLETDTSGYEICGILSQEHDTKHHSVAPTILENSHLQKWTMDLRSRASSYCSFNETLKISSRRSCS